MILFDSIKDASLEEQLKFYKEKTEFLQKQLNGVLDLLDAMPAYMYWKDINGIWLGANKGELDILSKTAGSGRKRFVLGDIVGKTNREIFESQEVADYLTANDNLAMDSGEVKVLEESFLHEDGRLQYFLSIKAPHRNKDGVIVGMVGTAFDITDRKGLEGMLQSALENASIVSQRTKQKFVDNLSHDIRTPITGMIGLVESIINDSGDNPKVYACGNILLESVNSFLRFFNSLLDSITEPDNTSDVNNFFDLEGLTGDCFGMFLPSITNKDLKFKVTGLDSLPKLVHTNKKIVLNILINIVGNAIKYTEKGEVKLHFYRELENLNYLKIQISDTGVGISKDVLDSILYSFKMIENGGEAPVSGLTAVKNYIDELNGCIEIKSALNSGSVITIGMPVEFADESNEVVVNKKVDINLANKLDVLVVEDNELALFALEGMLLDYDVNIDVAKDGKSALKMIKDKSYNIVFIDNELPYISGYEIINLSKSDGFLDDTVVIMLTSQGGKNTKNIGCHEYVVKPMQKDILSGIFGKYFD